MKATRSKQSDRTNDYVISATNVLGSASRSCRKTTGALYTWDFERGRRNWQVTQPSRRHHAPKLQHGEHVFWFGVSRALDFFPYQSHPAAIQRAVQSLRGRPPDRRSPGMVERPQRGAYELQRSMRDFRAGRANQKSWIA